MKPCFGCGLDTVDPEEPARYDVLREGVDLAQPETHGPYCAECWPSTATAAASA